MKSSLKFEEAAMAIAAIYLLSKYNLNLPLWIWGILFFAPDIGMLGYLVNTKIGAVMYNLFHHKAIAMAVAGIGYYYDINAVTAIGILLFAHASFHRIWGYGLKYPDNFKHTHLSSLN
jgi:Domain of unknown function (DUF4260)